MYYTMGLKPHAWTTPIIVCLSSAILVSINGLALHGTSKSADESTHVILLEEHFSSGYRGKRDADSSLPDKLSFGIFVNGSDVLLRLQKSNLLPTVTSDGDLTEADEEVLENIGVYTDMSLASAMIVEKEFGQYSLNGTFTYEETEWKIERVAVYKQDNGESRTSRHRLFASKFGDENIFNVADGILYPGDTQDTNTSERIMQDPLGKDNHRRKRDATRHVIEIAFIVDYAVYGNWIWSVGSLQSMRIWYTYIAESINIHYATIQDPDISITTTVTILKILTNSSDAEFMFSIMDIDGMIDGSEGLQAFYHWCQDQPDIPSSDHYMLFTGLNMYGSSGTAYLGTLCTNMSVSICEDSFTSYTHIVAAHELGHSLSIKHDENPNCYSSDQYVMAIGFELPVNITNRGNFWKFSNCSLAYMKTFLNSVACTLDNTAVGTTPKLPASRPVLKLGNLISRDSQCRIAFRNQQSYYCEYRQKYEDGGIESLCSGMYCRNPKYFYLCNPILPVQFTPCGDHKWCIEGQCVENTTTDVSSTAANHYMKTTTTVAYLPSTFPRKSKKFLKTLKTPKVTQSTETTPSTKKWRNSPSDFKTKIPKITPLVLTNNTANELNSFSYSTSNWSIHHSLEISITQIPATESQSTIKIRTVNDTTENDKPNKSRSESKRSKQNTRIKGFSRHPTQQNNGAETASYSACGILKLNFIVVGLMFFVQGVLKARKS